MKGAKSISVIILLAVMAGCGDKQSTDDVITVDVNTSYPEKELILQDFMDVEYVALETTGEFITQGVVKAIGKDLILVTNRVIDGDIFVFDRTGKGLRKINRFGQGGEEYLQMTELILDEDNSEMFVIDYPARKILVYDLYGSFKRIFKFTDAGYYTYTFNYDRDHLICYRSYLLTDNVPSGHLIISKQDGSVTREIQIPCKEIKTPVVVIQGKATITPTYHPTIPYSGNWALANTSSDTVYNCLPDGHTRPFIVRTPSIHSMNPEVFLSLSAFTDRYYFMHTLTKEFNFEKMKGFPGTDLVYDRQENAIFEYTVYNDDFSNKKQVYLDSQPVNHEIATCQSLEASDLVEAYGNGELKGKLKEIAATLDEEANPVIMLVKHKK